MARRRHDLGNDHLLDLCAARFDLFRLDASASEQICDLFRIFWKIDKFAQPIDGKFHGISCAVISSEAREPTKDSRFGGTVRVARVTTCAFVSSLAVFAPRDDTH